MFYEPSNSLKVSGSLAYSHTTSNNYEGRSLLVIYIGLIRLRRCLPCFSTFTKGFLVEVVLCYCVVVLYFWFVSSGIGGLFCCFVVIPYTSLSTVGSEGFFLAVMLYYVSGLSTAGWEDLVLFLFSVYGLSTVGKEGFLHFYVGGLSIVGWTVDPLWKVGRGDQLWKVGRGDLFWKVGRSDQQLEC